MLSDTNHRSIIKEERGRYARDQLFASDALLMGRETYEVFAQTWPSRTAADDGPGEAGYIDQQPPEIRDLDDPEGAARVERHTHQEQHRE